MSAVPELSRKLQRIRLLATDVDGVLTDGTLYYSDAGEVIKGFHSHDGLGLQLLMQAGIQVAIVSGRDSAALARRMAELGILHFFPGERAKEAAVAELAHRLGLGLDEVAFVGDDLPDLPVLRGVGVPIAVSDAHPQVRAAACWVTEAPGGRGAVREIADAILASRGPSSSDLVGKHALQAAVGAGHPAEPATFDPDPRGAADRSSDPCLDACWDAFYVAVPARYAASRLPGKPLRMLAGRPLIAHTWERAIESGARDVIVATDDERVLAAVHAFGGRALLTSSEHASGTDRIAEVADLESWPDAAIVVNLQGDEPFLDGRLVRSLAESLGTRPDAGIATLATPIRDAAELFDPNAVKVVLDDRQRALYFSRAPIPWVRGAFGGMGAPPPTELPPGVTFLRHLGIYAYRVRILRLLRDEKPRSLEHAELLEQLRALALGISIHVDLVDPAPARGVDTEEDLARAEQWATRARSSS